MSENTETPNLPAVPFARRVCRDAISVTHVAPVTALLTDAEARALIEQLQLALAYPARDYDSQGEPA